MILGEKRVGEREVQSGHGLGVHTHRLVMGYRVVSIGSTG